MLLAIDYIERKYPQRADLWFFQDRNDVEWIDLGRTALALDRVSAAGSSLAKLQRAIAQGRYEAILFGAPPPLWNPRKPLVRNLAKAARYVFGSAGSIELLRLYRSALRAARRHSRVAAVDRTDRMIIDNARFPILAASQLYFKRELPQNALNAFLYTTHKTECPENVLNTQFCRAQIDKLKPCSIGLDDTLARELSRRDAPKEVDLFFAGETKHRPQRAAGANLLRRLRDEGYVIDLPETLLPNAEYFERASRALLAWSPDGFGYDCFRTYEMAALGCVPVLPCPTIQRHLPFADGELAFHYFVDDDSLYSVVKRALQDRQRLREMGRRAREHVLAHHTSSALATHILDTLHTACA